MKQTFVAEVTKILDLLPHIGIEGAEGAFVILEADVVDHIVTQLSGNARGH